LEHVSMRKEMDLLKTSPMMAETITSSIFGNIFGHALPAREDAAAPPMKDPKKNNGGCCLSRDELLQCRVK
jgi:hypothetical protein